MVEETDHVILGAYPTGSLAVLTRADRRRHLYVIGKTGTGKSTLLLNLMHADLERGNGFALLDPHGDLATAVADAAPAWRTNDIIYLDPADLEFPMALNPLYNVAPDRRPLVAAHIVAAFQHIWGASWGPRLEYILTNSLRLLLDAPGSTLLGLPRLLSDERYRQRLLAHARDPVVRNFWKNEFTEYSNRYAVEAIAPIQNKVGTLLSPPALRNILGQPGRRALRRAAKRETFVSLLFSECVLADEIHPLGGLDHPRRIGEKPRRLSIRLRGEAG